MKIMIIEFKYRRVSYRFCKYIQDDICASLEAQAFLEECCRKMKADPERTTGKVFTVRGWHYWVEF
jgi:hypothetical protein